MTQSLPNHDPIIAQSWKLIANSWPNHVPIMWYGCVGLSVVFVCHTTNHKKNIKKNKKNQKHHTLFFMIWPWLGHDWAMIGPCHGPIMAQSLPNHGPIMSQSWKLIANAWPHHVPIMWYGCVGFLHDHTMFWGPIDHGKIMVWSCKKPLKQIDIVWLKINQNGSIKNNFI